MGPAVTDAWTVIGVYRERDHSGGLVTSGASVETLALDCGDSGWWSACLIEILLSICTSALLHSPPQTMNPSHSGTAIQPSIHHQKQPFLMYELSHGKNGGRMLPGCSMSTSLYSEQTQNCGNTRTPPLSTTRTGQD